jgi:hypothetical protein
MFERMISEHATDLYKELLHEIEGLRAQMSQNTFTIDNHTRTALLDWIVPQAARTLGEIKVQGMGILLEEIEGPRQGSRMH